MRFAATLPADETPPRIGARILVPGTRLLNEWDTTTGGGKHVRPHPIPDGAPARVGVVLDTRILRDGITRQIHRSELILEDAQPRLTGTGVLLSVLSGVTLCNPPDLDRFLSWCADRPLVQTEIPAAARAAQPWLREVFPQHADVARHVPRYDNGFETLAWVAGVSAVLGAHRLVPVPPGGTLDPTPDPMAEAEHVIAEALRTEENP